MPTVSSSSIERFTASEWLTPRWFSIPSVICRSIDSTGFSEVTGSWKIIAMSRPRTPRTSFSGRASRSRPMNSTLPVMVELLIMRTSPRMASALMLLPQPDSPTRPTVSPCSMAKLTPSTAWTAPSWLSNVTARSVTLSRMSPYADTACIKSFHRVFGKPPGRDDGSSAGEVGI